MAEGLYAFLLMLFFLFFPNAGDRNRAQNSSPPPTAPVPTITNTAPQNPAPAGAPEADPLDLTTQSAPQAPANPAIPTPALLPALLGFGAKVVQKRRSLNATNAPNALGS